MLSGLLEGVLAPFAVLRAARTTTAWSRYKRLIAYQLIAALAIMFVVVPIVLHKLDHDPDLFKIKGARFVAAYVPGLLAWWIAAASIYAAWLVVEWIIGAVSYMYVDEATDHFLVALQLPADDPKEGWAPRLRINVRRQIRRVMRQVLAGVVLASGAPLFALARVVPRIGQQVMTATITAWGLYWLLVTTAAKSDLAWLEPARLPWYLRVWKHVTSTVFGFRWWLPRAYGSLWHRVTRNLHGGAELVEEAPWQMAGLSIARILSNVPLIGMFLRPLIPVAVTLVVVRRRLGETDDRGKRADDKAA